MVLLCCDSDSLLYRACPASKGCNVLGITKEIDLCTSTGLQLAKSHLNGPNCLLCAALPCTGGRHGNVSTKTPKGGLRDLSAVGLCLRVSGLISSFAPTMPLNTAVPYSSSGPLGVPTGNLTTFATFSRRANSNSRTLMVVRTGCVLSDRGWPLRSRGRLLA